MVSKKKNREKLLADIRSLHWYHSLDLGDGIVTEGIYDHRPYLQYYGLPEDLNGKTALDIGAASGYFSFEMERRGAKVTAIDLPAWFEHDFGPRYQPDQTPETGQRYLREPFRIAKKMLASRVKKVEMNAYDISPQTVGMFDLVFCGSLLLHLTDPIRALWRIQSVTRELAIIATVIHNDPDAGPLAAFAGHEAGFVWWLPNRAGLEAMAMSAGFTRAQVVSEFQLNYRGQETGPYHGVLHAWNTEQPSLIVPEIEWPKPPEPKPPSPPTQEGAGSPGLLARLKRLVRRLL